MPNRVAILTDTNSGLTSREAAELGIYLVPMPVLIDGKTYFEEQTINQAEFYERLRAGADVSTAQPSPADLMEQWETLLKEYDEIVHIPMSSGLSGSCESAKGFAQGFGGRVQVVDNHRVSVTMRQSVLEAKHFADAGQSAQEIAAYLEKDGLESSIYIAVDTLKYLKKGGRVTPAGAALGSVLNIKPVLQIQGGKLDAYKKVRGMKAAMAAIIEAIRQDISERFSGQRLRLWCAYSGTEEWGEAWRQELCRAFPGYTVEKNALPLSIACHIGENSVAAALTKDILSE